MRIVALHTDFRLYWPARLAALRERFESRGDSFQVVEIAGKGSPYSFAGSNAESSDAYWHILYPESAMEDLNPSEIKPRLMKLLDELNPDVIISGAIAFPSGAVATAWANKHDRRVIVFDDSKIDVTPRSWVVNRIKRGVYNGVDAMLYPAKQWDATGKYWGFGQDRIFYGIDVVDNDFWRIPSERPYDKPYFLTVGRLVECKNIDGLICAYNRLVENEGSEVPDLLIIGEGPERCRLEAIACGKVKIIEFKRPEELRGYYQHTDMFILPSHKDTWGLVVNEAMSAGAICAVSRGCGCSESLLKGMSDFIFESHEGEGLYKVLKKRLHLAEAEKGSLDRVMDENIQGFSLASLCDSVEKGVDKLSKSKKRRGGILDRIIINRWEGRYNQA